MPSGRVPSLSFEFVILALLIPGPKHGYDIYKEMEAWTGLEEVWKLKQSMLYADLNKLEKLGLRFIHAPGSAVLTSTDQF